MTDAAATPWDGRPENPEEDGWHWLEYEAGGRIVLEWHATWNGELKGWWEGSVLTDTPKSYVTHRCLRYLGPCLTPAEVAAAVQAEREKHASEAAAEMKEARALALDQAAALLCFWPIDNGPCPLSAAQVFGRDLRIAAAIRALAQKEPRRGE